MKVILLIAVSCISSLSAEYPKFKVRKHAVPPSRYHPEVPHYAKKWQHQHIPSRNPVRSRPIPVHMSNNHKIPMGVPPKISRPISPPVRIFWKNTQNYQVPVEKQPIAFKIPTVEKPYIQNQDQPYLSLPAINNPDFDHQIQSNTISTHINPIKQVGEKGPIHTIPAPNLSLADKPSQYSDSSKQSVRFSQFPKYQTHQYQVTEQSELPSVKDNLYRTQITQQIQALQQQQQQQPQQLYYPSTNNQPQTLAFHSQVLEQKAPENEVYLPEQLNPKDLLQLLSQQQALQQYNAAEQQPVYLAQQPQLFQSEINYVQQVQAADKVGTVPEYYSFNYEEQPRGKDTEAKVTPFVVESLDKSDVEPRETLDAVSQAQYIQKYFDTRENAEENNVEPDAKPSVEQDPEKETKQELLSSAFYSSLPNKEAAETLAQLQAAGKINSNLMKLSPKNVSGKNHMTIYVPDDEESDQRGENRDDNEEQDASEDFERDYSEEEDGISEENRHLVNSTENDSSFGHRLQPKDSK